MRSRTLFLPYFLFACNFVNPLHAEPYWVAWEGNDYPENEGWTRQFISGGADRDLSSGAMRIDSTRSHLIYDQSVLERQVDAEAGELFVVEWRARVNVSDGPLWDQGVGIATDSAGLLILGLYRDAIHSAREGWTIPLEQGEFHTIRLESIDMESYSIYIDDSFARIGAFEPETLARSAVTFGDGSSGGGIVSNVDWDYFRFGVVPEPSSYLCLLSALACTTLWRRT